MVKDSNSDPQDEQYRKVFVGGLTLNTTEDAIRDFYSTFGTITDCVVMKDPNTRRSRGFGFVTFTTSEEVDKAMKARPHVIDEKTVDPKRAVPREASQKNEANISTKRLYVSGIREEHSEKDFEDYFSKYGTVEKVEIIKDKTTGKYRGFAFISFDDYDPVDKCCLERQHMILNHRCDVKKALSREEIAKAQQMDRDRAERGNRSRGNARGSNQWNNEPQQQRHGGWGNRRESGGYAASHHHQQQQSWAPPGGGYGASWGQPSYGAPPPPQQWGQPSGYGAPIQPSIPQPYAVPQSYQQQPYQSPTPYGAPVYQAPPGNPNAPEAKFTPYQNRYPNPQASQNPDPQQQAFHQNYSWGPA